VQWSNKQNSACGSRGRSPERSQYVVEISLMQTGK